MKILKPRLAIKQWLRIAPHRAHPPAAVLAIAPITPNTAMLVFTAVTALATMTTTEQWPPSTPTLQHLPSMA